jgi:hypothetical protein
MKIADVRRYALSLPEAAEEPHFQYASFRVRGKIFATVPTEKDRLHIFVPEEDREPVVAAHPDAFENVCCEPRGARRRLRRCATRMREQKEPGLRPGSRNLACHLGARMRGQPLIKLVLVQRSCELR